MIIDCHGHYTTAPLSLARTVWISIEKGFLAYSSAGNAYANNSPL